MTKIWVNPVRVAAVCLLLLSCVLAALNFWANYWLGYSESPRALFASARVVGFAAECVVFLVFMALAFVGIFQKGNGNFLLNVFLAFWPLYFLTLYSSRMVLGPAHALVLRGLHDRIAQDVTLDELRHFARDVDKSGILPTERDWINHGDVSRLDSEKREAFSRLKAKYVFLRWMDDGKNLNGPSIAKSNYKGFVDFEWGGPLPGHWGCSISINGSKNDPHAGDLEAILRLSDDIYLYFGP